MRHKLTPQQERESTLSFLISQKGVDLIWQQLVNTTMDPMDGMTMMTTATL